MPILAEAVEQRKKDALRIRELTLQATEILENLNGTQIYYPLGEKKFSSAGLTAASVTGKQSKTVRQSP